VSGYVASSENLRLRRVVGRVGSCWLTPDGWRQRIWNASEILCPYAKPQQQQLMTRFVGSDVAGPTGPRSPALWAWAARLPVSDTFRATEPPLFLLPHVHQRPPVVMGRSGSGLAL